MAEKRRLNLAFSLAQPHQCKAWNGLSAIPAGQRTDAVCRLIRDYLSLQELLEAVRVAVREEMGQARPPLQQQNTVQAEAESVNDDVLGFLFALQNGDDDT